MQEKFVLEKKAEDYRNIIDSGTALRDAISVFSQNTLSLDAFSETAKINVVNRSASMCGLFLRKLVASIKAHGEYLIDDGMHVGLKDISSGVREFVSWYENFIKNNIIDPSFAEMDRAEAAGYIADIEFKLDVFESAIDRVVDVEFEGEEVEGLEEYPDIKEQLKQEVNKIAEVASHSVNSYLSSFSTRLEEILINHEKVIDSSKNKIEIMDSNLNSMFSILASKSIAGGFMKNAESEREAANIFRGIAVGLMVVMATIIWFEFENNVGTALSQESLYWRLAIGLFFSFVLGYLIRQSAVHRGQQFYYQQKAFDMAAINPYLANMPEDKKFEIKKHIAERIFVPASTVQGGDVGGFGAQEIVSKIIDKLELPKKKD